ncbi:DNA mismatch repair protein Msh3 [Cordyceps militaris CM01]|uniref:DNA mismatch repair protein n=1 Tax=Cordyceps militaris (strain CM01) TaxID=983644 RepID=G3JKI4_CORMM|nr:DNA mismatch repair protein Msh3 [Cordyceps militaris CM01]EGX91423.1 DNA mismatch repair protein Msh3 [Cordyceps militaris CM01]
MPPTSTPVGKKQQSLTSFFTPKAASSSKPPAASTQSPTPSKPPRRSAASAAPSERKRSIDELADKENHDLERDAKKAKTSALADDGNGDAPLPVQTPVSARAQRYSYSTAPTSTDQTEADDGADDEATKKRYADLHKKFIKKLGHPDAMNWRSRIKQDHATEENEDGDGEAEEDDVPAPKSKKKGSKTGKLTPMEIQFLDIKRKHLDTILIVEVGYKFRFFGEDARVAAKELSIVCIPGKMRYDEHPSEAHLDRFASASIPVHRLPVHARRLVAAGHKVGVVRQVETAALKKVGDNRNAPFTRKLTNLYTKGTYIDENGDLEQSTQGGNTSSSGGYLLCLTESKAKGAGTDEKVDVGILAVQPATGDIIYDTFEDGFMRSEIETRLLHISPCEFVIVGDLTKATDKLIQHLAGSSTNVFGDRSRVERVPRTPTMAAEAASHVTQFYAEKMKEATSSQNEQSASLLEKVLRLPEAVTICLSAMMTHLTEYGLEHIFDLTKYFESFSTRAHMLVNGTTLESLEVYRNATDHAERGSLFWAIDKTLTRFGRRLLRKWLGRPLLHQADLEARLVAVKELHDKRSTAAVGGLERLLAKTRTDLERCLVRIYYGKCTRPELLAALQALQQVASHYASVKTPADAGFDAPLLTDAVLALPQILGLVVSHLERINLDAARKDDKYGFFRDEHQTEDMEDHQMGIAHVEHQLDQHRAAAAEQLKHKKPVDYVTVAGIEFLIEVPNSDIKHVPASWAKISGTKKVSRFHTPAVVQLVAERDQHREALAAACDAAFRALLASVAAAYQPLRDAVSALATLDCLLSLSKVAAQPGYTCPEFLPSSAPPTIAITGGRHPMAEQTLAGGYIPFSTTLAHPTPRAHLVTGPNMGGKSSFVRALALIVLLAQVGSFVPADALRMTLCDAIHTRTGARDNLFASESTFMVEVSETARILRAATPRSLVILDELGRGTSTHDGAAIAQAVLHHVVAETRCLTLFITHYQNLARVADGLDGLTNVHMKFKADTGPDGEEEITFLYEVGEGVAHRSYGLNVARLAHIPKKVIDVAAERSSAMESEMRTRRFKGACRMLSDVMGDSPDQLDNLISSIDQL